MSVYNPSSLSDLTDRTVSSGVIPSADHEAWRNDVEARVVALNDIAAALATMQSGTTNPFSLQGSIWADTANANRVIWKGDPDGAGHDDEFLTRLEAWRVSLATGGTATFKLGGRITTDTTQTTKAGNATGAFTSKTVPGGTLGSNGQGIYAFFSGTKSANNGEISLAVQFGGTGIGTHQIPVVAATVSPWAIEAWIWRTGATTQKAVSVFYANRDDTGSVSLAVYSAALGKTLANDNTLALYNVATSGSASDNIVQEVMMWKYIG